MFETRQRRAYWPHLLKDEPALEAWGIYVYNYATGVFSGTYNLNDVGGSI